MRSTSNKLQTLINSCLRSIPLKIRWPVRKDQQYASLGANEPSRNLLCNKYAGRNGGGLDRPYSEETNQQVTSVDKPLLKCNPKGKQRVGRQCEGDLEEVM
uniref:Uncharacterized protein n=1 Tax=Trichobilharzia regenti TaxID=157069 RepID=A0AA85JCF3_TRIRE|nr:unnamed protein product [Trichobilharzia regenti]